MWPAGQDRRSANLQACATAIRDARAIDSKSKVNMPFENPMPQASGFFISSICFSMPGLKIALLRK
jgi:hypothetical protein